MISRMTYRLADRLKPFAGAALCLLVSLSGAHAHGGDELGVPPLPYLSPTGTAGSTNGVSGTRPTPLARAGQTLPLKATRTIAFDTDEGTALSLDLSPDGRTLVFDLLGDIYTLPVKGGKARAITRGMAFDSQPMVSPDGSRIVFLSDRSGAENLWTMRIDGSDARQVTLLDDNPIFASPTWTADGKNLLVTRFWPDRNAYELWQYGLAGEGHVVVPNRSTPDTPRDAQVHSLGAAPTADGRAFYVATRTGSVDFDEAGEWQIAKYDIATKEISIIVKAIGDIRLGPVQSSAFRPVVSRDGRWLAYGLRSVGRTSLRLRELATGLDREILPVDHDSLQSSLWSDVIPHFAFTPDDQALIVSTGGKIHRITLATGADTLIPFTAHVDMPLGPLTRTPIVQETGPVRARLIQHPQQSPDGQTLAFSALGHIYRMALDGTDTPRRLNADDAPAFHPAWSPDGKWLTYVMWTAKDGGQIRVARADGSEPRTITRLPAFYTHPVFLPDGSGIIVVRSPQGDRLNSYVEFGQLREADLVRIALAGREPTILMHGRIGGIPHFGPDPSRVYINTQDGVRALSENGGESTLVTQALGPGWYFSEGAAPADDIRISPDGKWALAQIAQQLHLYALDATPGQSINLSLPQVRHRQITDIGADFFGWADGGRMIVWSIGSTYYRRPLDSVSLDAAGAPPGRPDATGHAIAQFKAPVLVPRDTPHGALLLRGGTAITMRGTEVLLNADILIVDDHIRQVGPRGSFPVPAAAAVRDLSGAFIIPGLIDAHDHVADIRRDVLDLHNWGPAASLAYGVTTTFDPSSLTIDMLAYQDLVDSGAMLGSRIVTTGPALFSFNDFRSKADVVQVLKRYRDHYRITNLKQYRTGNRRVRQWIVEAAAELGMTPTSEGALSTKLDLTHVIDGYSGNEHSLNPPKLYNDIIRLYAESGTSAVPTLQITHGGRPAQDYFITRTAPHHDPKYARFSPAWFRDQKFWQRTWHDQQEYAFPEVAQSMDQFQRAGGILGLGAHGEVPGLGTHWEMQAYAMGGMAPMDVLKAATLGSARTIGREREFGSIEAGKYADLVILNRNPLDDITQTLAIRQVMKNGRLYDADSLSQLWPVVRPMAPFWFSEASSPRP
ncbi:amidohydrolase family protein [Sphingobium subterraneum]|uniref:Tol biopolymer transport system component/imidazolonepropionase-like amidohydrolase n=1 Tax=Sphingobium subterraneum TaxID=627688 RepID=A0A841IYJ3_9SPHN|nr:amidohydrolase family protein [Sphingobium subterraneum]MBB6123733.1 Tol biopolymer transport system component/imidazolonepropionase-like amidohydrolase [Sphingobium subterraneum]